MKMKFMRVIAAAVAIFGIGLAQAKVTEAEFQDHVLSYLKKEYASHEFRKSTDPLVIQMGSAELGLQNIYATYKAKEFKESDLSPLLKEHFARIIKSLKKADERATPSWDQARAKVRPQFAPRSYTEKIPLVYETLDEYIVSAYVIDSDEGYQYITEDNLKHWNIDIPELRAAATDNLDAASREMAMQVSNGDEKFIALQVLDGYDAARILMPGFRTLLAERLGSPFYVALSNRDFLVMWSGQNSRAFKEFAENKAKTNFQVEPYPLSPNVFLVTPDGIERSK